MVATEPSSTGAPRFENKGILRFVEDSETVLARMDRATIEIFPRCRSIERRMGRIWIALECRTENISGSFR